MKTHKLSEKDKLRWAELKMVERLITEVYPEGIVSLVMDTYNLWNVLDPENGILFHLKDKIMARNGKVVIRPDSGDPVKIVTGWTDEEQDEYDRQNHANPLSEVEAKGMIRCLYELFGGTPSKTGYVQLDEHIGGIYGDSITLERAETICRRLADNGFASTNLVYGIGSFTYQGAVTPNAIITRDTHCFAVKATYTEVQEGDETLKINIFKDPITDDGMKKSAKGITAVYQNENGGYYLKDEATMEELRNCAFVNVFNDGKIVKEWTLSEIRERVANQWT